MLKKLLLIGILMLSVLSNIEANPNEPPIHIIFDVHIEPIGGGPNYFQRRTEVNWLRETALAYGAKLTLESNGEYMEYCLENGHQTDFQAYLEAGFDVGTHSHLVTYEGPHQWVSRHGEKLTFDLVNRIIGDAEFFVDSVIGADQNFHLCTQTNKAYIDTMMRMHDFRFVTGPGEEGYWAFGHLVWNPFRPASGDGVGTLEEDLTAPYMTIPHLPQINKPDAHGMNLLLPQLKRRFLMIYLEWLYRVRNGIDDKIWVWGFNTHACQNYLQRDAVEEMLAWLNEHFINHNIDTGDTIAVYASGSEIYRKYLDWERNRPGVSSFSFVDGDPYPYTYSAMPTILEEAAYDSCVDMGENLNVHRLLKGGPLYVIWTNSGTDTIDFSSQIPWALQTTDGFGHTGIQDYTQLIVTEEPLFVQPLPFEPDPPPIHVSIVTHNEEPLSGQYPDFVNDEDVFWQHRNAVLEFSEMIHQEGVQYNFQSDWNFLLAATLYDEGTPSTNEKNLFRYLKEDLDFEVDPHAHETQYNYADVAYLIESLGVPVSNTVGGFLAYPPEQSKVEYFRQPLTGWMYPEYTWEAEILWGGATMLHQDEESLWISGVWKPKDNDNFLTHDDDALLPYIGNYQLRDGWEGLSTLLEKQQSYQLESGEIYTQTIFVGQNSLLDPQFIEDFRQQIQSISGDGLIRWVGLAELIDIWVNEYDADPNMLPFIEESSAIPYESSRFGIFGAYALEYDWFMQQMGFDDSDYWGWVDDHFANLGAHWTRSNTQLIWELIEPDLDGNYIWDIPTNPDGVITNVCDSHAGVNWLGCIHVGMGKGYFRNPLDYPAQWQNFLKAVVDRYNGDGNNDLNSDVRIKYWQLGNEVFALTDAGVTPEQYAEIVALSETAIRSIDPEAKICLIAPTTGKQVDPFLVQSISALINQDIRFDVIDVHHWDTADDYKMYAVSGYRQLLDEHGGYPGYGDIEIWSCEHGTWCYQPDQVPAQTKREQAQSLVKRCLWNFANGLDKLFWNNLMEWHGFGGQAGSIFNCIGLIGDGSYCGEPAKEFNHMRKAYYSYKKLSELIDAQRANYVGIKDFFDENRGLFGYIWQDVETDTVMQFVWTDSTETFVIFSVLTPCLWTSMIPCNDEGDFESITLEPRYHTFQLVSGDVYLLRGMAMPIRELRKGDVRGDGRINIQDVLRVVQLILHQPPTPTESELWAADHNGDGIIDVLDVIGIVRIILGVGA